MPFSVQGPDNALCLDGGRTIGWEISEIPDADVPSQAPDRVFVQVGGGAFAACVGAAFRAAGVHPIVHAVQTAGLRAAGAGVGPGAAPTNIRSVAGPRS